MLFARSTAAPFSRERPLLALEPKIWISEQTHVYLVEWKVGAGAGDR